MEAVPRLFMISCDLKVSPNNTEFGPTLKKYIKDHYREDAELYTKEIKELETLRQGAVKAPMDFTGCSILKRYYSQLLMLQSRFPMTDDGAACVPFMWTDIYSGVAYNITDIEYEAACILYNIGALHSKLGTMDSRINAEGMKIGCTHFQCAAWAFQHLRDSYPQPKGSDMSHDLLSFFINVMLAQAQECILEKSMLDSRKSTITAKIAAQVVDYYKCAQSKLVKGSPNSGGFYYIVGSKVFGGWKKSIEFKVSYYMSISHLFMGNQSEEHEKWGERVAWFQSALDHLEEASKLAKNMGRDDLNEPLTFLMDVVGGKHNSAKKENEFVYHEKVPPTESLQELKGASLVKGIPFSPTDPDVSGPDIFARLVPMEAHETSSLYSEEKAKILRSVVSKIEEKNEELMAYLSSLQLDDSTTLEEDEKIPQQLLEKCAAISVQPTATSDLTELMSVLIGISRDVELALKSCNVILKEEEHKELKYQENFGKRVPSMIIVELTKECSKYEDAHKKAVESNKTLQTAVNIHLENLCKLSSPLEDLVKLLPSVSSVKTPDNVKVMQEFNHLLSKVDEMRNQRHYLEQQLRDSLLEDDITKRLVTLDKKEDVQRTFSDELKKHDQLLTYLDQNLAAQDNILCALTQANARTAETRKAILEIKQDRECMVQSFINSYEAYEDLISKAKKGLEFYEKLHTNSSRLLSRVRSVTKVQDEERVQITEAELRKGARFPATLGDVQEKHTPKLRDYLPYLSKRDNHDLSLPPASNTFSAIPHHANLPAAMPQQITPKHFHKPTVGGTPADFDRNLKPVSADPARSFEDNPELPSMGVRPAPLGSEHNSVPAMCTSPMQANNIPADLKQISQYAVAHHWKQTVSMPNSQLNSHNGSFAPYPNQNAATYGMQTSGGQQYQDPTMISSYHQATMPVYSTSSAAVPHPNTGYNVSSTAISQTASGYNTSSGIVPHPGTVYSISSNAMSPEIDPSQLSQQPYAHPYSQTTMEPNKGYFPQATNVAYNAGQTIQQTGMTSSSVTGAFSSLPGSSEIPSNSYNHLQGLAQSNLFPYSTTGYPSQARPGISTSQMDTRTNTFSSLNSNPMSNTLGNVTPKTGYVSQPVGRLPVSAAAANMTENSIFSSGHLNLNNPMNPQNYIPSSSYYSSTPAVQTQMVYLNSNMPANPPVSASSPAGSYTPYASQASSNIYATPAAINIKNGSSQIQSFTNSSNMPYLQQNPTVVTTVQQHIPNGTVQSQYPSMPHVQQNPTMTPHQHNSNIGYVQQNVNVFPQHPSSSTVHQNHNMIPAESKNRNFRQNTSNLPQQNTLPTQQFPSSAINTQQFSSHTVSGQQYSSNVAGTLQSNMAGTQQYSSNAAIPQQNQMTFVQQNSSMQGMQNTNVLSSSSNQLNSQSSLPETAAFEHISQYNFNAAGSVMNQNAIPNQQLHLPITPLAVTPSHPLEPMTAIGDSNSNVVVSKAYVADRRPSSTPLDSNPKLSIARDFITPPPDTISSRLDCDASNTDLSSQSSFQILQPKVLDLKNIVSAKEKDQMHLAKDPLDDPSVRSKFVTEVEKYEKLVEGLVRKSLNGTTPLDQKWKELTDAQDKESRKMSISVARCYPLKNRYPDVMPFDSNRVKLTSAKDDYINASYLKDICSSSPVFILTQSPLPTTFNDFWTMAWEQQVETLLCVLPDSELKNHTYFPKEKGQLLTFGPYEVSLHSYKEKVGFTERMINLTQIKNRMSRVVVHLQFTLWPASGIPSSTAPVLQFITDVLNYQKQQRNLLRPVVVHCSAGIGRSGCLCLITALVTDMNCGHGPKDVAQVVATLSQQRKFLIQDKDQLKFCYDTVLYYAQDLLMRRGILTSRASFDDKLPGSGSSSTHVRHPSEDFILGGGGLAKLQSDMVKMGLSDSADLSSKKVETSNTECGAESGDVTPCVTSAENTESKCVKDDEVSQDVTVPENKLKQESLASDKSLNSITSLLDPSNFTLDSASPAKRKITKEAFTGSKGSLATSSGDSADPLSQLDPLWSLKKK